MICECGSVILAHNNCITPCPNTGCYNKYVVGPNNTTKNIIKLTQHVHPDFKYREYKNQTCDLHLIYTQKCTTKCICGHIIYVVTQPILIACSNYKCNIKYKMELCDRCDINYDSHYNMNRLHVQSNIPKSRVPKLLRSSTPMTRRKKVKKNAKPKLKRRNSVPNNSLASLTSNASLIKQHNIPKINLAKISKGIKNIKKISNSENSEKSEKNNISKKDEDQDHTTYNLVDCIYCYQILYDNNHSGQINPCMICNSPLETQGYMMHITCRKCITTFAKVTCCNMGPTTKYCITPIKYYEKLGRPKQIVSNINPVEFLEQHDHLFPNNISKYSGPAI